MSRKKVTMQMIADLSGYSKYVVSKALNGKDGVGDSTRQKIFSVAKQLGYLKSNPTKSESFELDKNKSSNEFFVLVIMPNHRYQNSESNYWSKIFDGVIDSLESLNIGVIVISSQNNLSGHVKANRLLGVITVGLVSTDMLLELNKHTVPIVMVDHEDSIIKADNIFMDNLNGTNTLTNYLIGLGHKRLFFVGDNSFSLSFYNRWLGFRNAMETSTHISTSGNWLLSLDYNSQNTEGQIEKHLDKLLVSNTIPTAFVCANDDIAETVMDLLKKKDFSIPDDCSVTGFDNLEDSDKLSPSLTSVQVLKQSIGRRAVSMLLWRLENGEYPPEKIHVSCEMVIRNSVSYPTSVPQ